MKEGQPSIKEMGEKLVTLQFSKTQSLCKPHFVFGLKSFSERQDLMIENYASGLNLLVLGNQ